MFIDRWCRALARRPEGRVLLRNLLYDLERQRIPDQLARQLFEHIAEQLDHAAHDVPDERVTAGAEAGNEIAPELALSLVERFCQEHPTRSCQGSDRPDEPQDCSRVLDEQSCLKFNFRPAYYGLPAEDEVPPWFFEEVAKHPLEPGGVRGEMTTRRGFTWVTSTSELGQVTESSDSAADTARRKLGLNHFGPGTRLLSIHYPEGVPWSSRHGAPTALEGGSSAVFRSRQHDDGWGRAIDLRHPERDGLPELTHEPVPFDASFRLEVLGHLEKPETPTDAELADATSPHTERWLETSIQELDRIRRRVGENVSA